ncbi:MAG TPA: NAD(P)-dependent oxidoreductase [Gammaproteobacteria bacterium]|nr:NAD(P)-dependent oxidoreductase [Gammaproteobacteria bacterium]
MKALVTGAYGFIGLNVVSMLISRGFDVDCIDIVDPKDMDNEGSSLLLDNTKNIKYHQINLLDTKHLDYFATNYTHIFHFAGFLGVQNVLDNPSKTLYDNSIMAWNIAEFSKKQEKLELLFYTSTSEVYAGTLENYDMPIPTPETVPLALTGLDVARTSYMLSKIWGEAVINYSQIPSYILRPHNIYGPRMGMRHVIPQLLKRAHTIDVSSQFDVYSPTHTRAFCYIDDAVNFILGLIDSPAPQLCTVLNIGNSEEEISVRSLGETILDVVGKSCAIKECDDTPGSPLRRCPDITNLTNITGYTPRISIQEGVRKTYNWYKDNEFAK